MRVWVGFCWVITFLATCVAGLQLFNTFVRAESAPQQAAGAALAVALAVIPYIFTRCWQGLATIEDRKRTTDLLERIPADSDHGQVGPGAITADSTS